MWRRSRSGSGSDGRAGDAVERKRHREHGRVVLNVDSCDRDVRIVDVRPAHGAESAHQVARFIKLGITTRSDGLPRRKIFELVGVEFLPLGLCGWGTWWFCVDLRDRWWFCVVLRRRTAETGNAPAAARVAAPAAAAPAAARGSTRMAAAAEDTARGTCSSCGAWHHGHVVPPEDHVFQTPTTGRCRRRRCPCHGRAAAGASAGCGATLIGNLRRNLELLGVVGGTIVVAATLARCRCDGSLGPQSGCLSARFIFVVVCEACANGRYFLMALVRSVAPHTTHLSGVSASLR